MRCPYCFKTNKCEAVHHIVENDFEGIENVHEKYEHLLQKPNAQSLNMKLSTAIKMTLTCSILFTPFIGPFITGATWLLCKLFKDKQKLIDDMERWKQLIYCKNCQKIW